jgi:2'-hydroxyisoflavone reductase
LQGDRDGQLEALRGRHWDAVIDTCGYVPRIVRASAELLAGRVEHYTFISTGSVYRDTRVPGVDEHYPVGTITDEKLREVEQIKPSSNQIIAKAYGEFYGPLKALCERAAEEALPGRVLNVRAGLIVGPFDYSDRFTYWARRIAQGGDVLAPGNPDSPLQFVDVRDLSEWLVRMAEARQTGTFNATGPDYKLTMRRFLEECRTATGSDARLVWMDEEFLLAKGVEAWSEVPLWTTEADLENRYFLSVSIDQALASGLTSRLLAETVRDTLAWDSTRPTNIERRAGLDPVREKELLEAWQARTAG